MSTRIAFVTDIHGDVHALADALRWLDAHDIRTVVCLGDLLDYGVFADEVMSLLAKRGIPTLRGNHDRWAMTNKSVGLNATDLTAASRKFLKKTLPSWSATIEGVRVAGHHARPGSDMHGIMPDADASELRKVLDAADADVLVVGHTHVAMDLLTTGNRHVLNPGALLRDPADGWDELPSPGTFGVLELPSKRWTVIRARTGEESTKVVRRTVA